MKTELTIGEKLLAFDESLGTVKDFNEVFGNKIVRFHEREQVEITERLTDTLLELAIGKELIRVDISPILKLKEGITKFIYQITDKHKDLVFYLHSQHELREVLDLSHSEVLDGFKKSKVIDGSRYKIEMMKKSESPNYQGKNIKVDRSIVRRKSLLFSDKGGILYDGERGIKERRMLEKLKEKY